MGNPQMQHPFFRNGVLPASASIDAHIRFIEKMNQKVFVYKYHNYRQPLRI
jgi:hypothetical protein